MPEDRTTVFRMPGGLMAELKCHRGIKSGQTFSLSSGTFVIGRSSGSDLVLTDEPGVSKIHAKIIAEDEKYYILDNESRNGTLVNGKPINKKELNHGDVLQICGCSLTFYCLGATGVSTPATMTGDSENASQTQTSTQSTKEQIDNEKDTSAKFYSDEKAHSGGDEESPIVVDEHIDEEADTLQPTDHDTLVGEQEGSEDSMTVTAAMVNSAPKSEDAESRSQDAYNALAQVKERQGEQKPSTKTVKYQDMRIGTFTGSGKGTHDPKNIAEKQTPQKSSSARSFVFGLLVAIGLYTGWLYLSNMNPAQKLEIAEDKIASNEIQSDTVPNEGGEQNDQDFSGALNNGDDWFAVEMNYGRKYPVAASSSGVVSNLTVNNGDLVFVGQSLFTLTNDRLSSDIETIKLEIAALERLAKTNNTEFVKEGLREEKQKLRTLRSQQKKIIKSKFAGVVTNLNQLNGKFVKRGKVVLLISQKDGPPRISLKKEMALEMKKGRILEVKSKNGQRHQVTILRKEIRSGQALLTVDFKAERLNITAVRLLPDR